MAGIKCTGGLTHGRGFTESTRLLFLLSRPICADASQSIFDMAGLSQNSGDAHRDLAPSRIRRDIRDIHKLVNVFRERGPFNTSTTQLVSISTGLVADDSVNAGNAKSVGDIILSAMVGHSVAEYKFCQKNQVKTLASATHVKTATGERIEMDAQHLYQRLLMTGMGDIAISDLFQYELCCLPPSLFDNHMRMRTGDKAEIIHHLLKLAPTCIIPDQLNIDLQFVVDGGALIHKFNWPKHSSYDELCAMYTCHVHNSYEHALVVFDGYHGFSTKDEAHQRRIGNDMGATVSVSSEMRLTMSKKAFLANPSNKQAFINLLAENMISAAITVEHAKEDADYKICLLACISAMEKPTAVIADDTDIFQLLVYHADITGNSCNLYMITSKRTICITTLKVSLDPVLSGMLPFLHALSGCDTTSRLYGIGKTTVLSKYAAIQNHANTFMSPTSSKRDIQLAGEAAMLVIYGCTPSQTLNAARVEKFQLKVATANQYVSPEKLPPTSDAASFHSHRVYHQVQRWLGNDLSPDDWGWISSSSGYKPVRMSQPAAPERLLKVIRCNCGGNCDKKTCTCRKNAMQCTAACGQCKGITCMNASQPDSDTDTDDDNDI